MRALILLALLVCGSVFSQDQFRDHRWYPILNDAGEETLAWDRTEGPVLTTYPSTNEYKVIGTAVSRMQHQFLAEFAKVLRIQTATAGEDIELFVIRYGGFDTEINGLGYEWRTIWSDHTTEWTTSQFTINVVKEWDTTTYFPFRDIYAPTPRKIEVRLFLFPANEGSPIGAEKKWTGRPFKFNVQ